MTEHNAGERVEQGFISDMLAGATSVGQLLLVAACVADRFCEVVEVDMIESKQVRASKPTEGGHR